MLAAIAAKGVKELTYHRDYAANWVVRLGDGTELSHERMQSGLDDVWPLVDELFATHPVETALAGIAVDPARCAPSSTRCSTRSSTRPTLTRPDAAPLAGVAGRTGRDGVHTEAFGFVLAELQSVARAHPEATW